MSQYLFGDYVEHRKRGDDFIDGAQPASPSPDFTLRINTAPVKVTPTSLVILCESCDRAETGRLWTVATDARNKVDVTHGNITKATTAAIVNAANKNLGEGGGVCGAIFGAVKRAGGHAQLTAACREIGHCPTGDAVITPSFGLAAPWIIHAVGPVWRGRKWDEINSPLTEDELSQLRELGETYVAVLRVCRENGVSSVTIPAISTGIYGLPKELGAAIARTVCARDAGDLKVTLIAYEDDSHETLAAAPTAAALRMLSSVGLW